MAELTRAFQPLPGVGPNGKDCNWNRTGERTIECPLTLDWDVILESPLQLHSIPSVLDDAGNPLPETPIPIPLLTLDPAVQSLDFDVPPSASWGQVRQLTTQDPRFPQACLDGSCVRLEGTAMSAWQLDTIGADEARVTLVVPDGRDPSTYTPPSGNDSWLVTLTAIAPGGEPLPLLEPIRDVSLRTFSYRVATMGYERVGIEVKVVESLPQYDDQPGIYLQHAEALLTGS